MRNNNWTEKEIILALSLYLQKVPFSKISKNNKEVIKLANTIGRTPGAVGLKLANLSNCDPSIRNSGRSGMSHGAKLDKEVWDKFVTNNNIAELFDITEQISKEYGNSQIFIPDIEQSVSQDLNEPAKCVIDNTEVTVTIKQRRGQSYFRNAVLNNFENRCAITGIGQTNLIEAAHILPWNMSDNERRLSPKNGLALNVLLHRAYDANLIGIDQDLKVHVSGKLLKDGFENSKQFFNNINQTSIIMPKILIPDQDLLKERFTDFITNK